MLTLAEVLKVTQGKLLNSFEKRSFSGVCTDSRSLKKNDLFIAIKGDRFDGHDFIAEVIKKGAGGIIVSKDVLVTDDVPIVKVKDTIKALGYLALFHRTKFHIPVIAITGSAGKTTTKEMLAHVLSSGLKVLKNHKTENNHMGVPQTLLRLNSQHQAIVIEVGTNQKGDIRWLTEIVEPTMAVYTNIGDSHLLGLKDRNGVFKEKYDLVKYMKGKGRVIFNADNTYLRRIGQKKISHKKISYGIENQADIKAREVSLDKKGRTHFLLSKIEFILDTPAKHNVYNALAVIACAKELNIGIDIIEKRLKKFRFTNGRCEIKMIGQYQVIDDTYNANPLSLSSAISTLDSMTVRGRKILVCGDMLELGTRSKILHEQMGDLIAKTGIDLLLTIGDQAKFIALRLRRINPEFSVFHCRDLDEIYQRLSVFCRPQDTLLFKGSRGMKMERAVELLKGLG